jgi:hypothetical protein
VRVSRFTPGDWTNGEVSTLLTLIGPVTPAHCVLLSESLFDAMSSDLVDTAERATPLNRGSRCTPVGIRIPCALAGGLQSAPAAARPVAAGVE